MSVRTASGGKAAWASGTSGTYVDIPEVRGWTLDVNATSKTYASSSTGGGKQRIGGAEEFTGTLSLYVDRTSGTSGSSFDTDLGIQPGETGTLKLYEDSGNFFTAPAYIESAAYNVSIEDDNIIEGTVQFSRNGALVYPTE